MFYLNNDKHMISYSSTHARFGVQHRTLIRSFQHELEKEETQFLLQKRSLFASESLEVCMPLDSRH